MSQAPATVRRLSIAPAARGDGWRLTREHGPDTAAALIGRTPQEAARMAPLVFNLCGAAHGLAAATALGLPGTADARAMAHETVRDHALAILHAWPVAMGGAPDRDALRLLARPGGEAAFAEALVGDAGDLSRLSPAELEAWLAAAPTGTARLLAHIRRQVDPTEGRAGLPELTAQDLAQALGDLDAPDACVPPGGRETGVLGRVARTPLLAALLAAEGPSLFVRLLARLVDCLAALRPAPLDDVPAPAGLGFVPAARGLLGHGARVVEGRVAAYRILSPSAWNLAPGGLMDRAFAALTPGPQAAGLARLLVSAINPCVPVTLAVPQEAAHA